MQTIGEAAKELDIPKSTVRGWVSDFNDFLSDNAKPPKGEVKQLDRDDMAVLWSVHFWRSQHKSKPDIYDLLESGERFIPEAARGGQDNAGEEETGEELGTAVVNALTLYQGKIDDLTERLIAAETRAAVAERELEIMRSLADKKKAWWRFWE